MMLPLPKKHQTIAEDKNKLISIVKREANASLFFVLLVLESVWSSISENEKATTITVAAFPNFIMKTLFNE